MELTEIKSRFFGYSKKNVCQYISELNAVHETELEAQKESNAKAADNYNTQIKALENSNKELSETISDLKRELEEVKAALTTSEAEKQAVTEEYNTVLRETEELRSKSDVISTAIINAERCATSMINEAGTRAQDMIDEAHIKVEDEVRKLETAKAYITEVRSAVDRTLKKIDAELGGIETDISSKAQNVNSDKKSSVKEKFGLLDKNFFKKA